MLIDFVDDTWEGWKLCLRLYRYYRRHKKVVKKRYVAIFKTPHKKESDNGLLPEYLPVMKGLSAHTHSSYTKLAKSLNASRLEQKKIEEQKVYETWSKRVAEAIPPGPPLRMIKEGSKTPPPTLSDQVREYEEKIRNIILYGKEKDANREKNLIKKRLQDKAKILVTDKDDENKYGFTYVGMKSKALEISRKEQEKDKRNLS